MCAQVYLLLFLFCYRCMLNAWCFCGIMALIAHTNEAAFGAKLCSVWSPIDKHTNIFYAVSNTWHRIWNGLKMKLKTKNGQHRQRSHTWQPHSKWKMVQRIEISHFATVSTINQLPLLIDISNIVCALSLIFFLLTTIFICQSNRCFGEVGPRLKR